MMGKLMAQVHSPQKQIPHKQIGHGYRMIFGKR